MLVLVKMVQLVVVCPEVVEAYWVVVKGCHKLEAVAGGFEFGVVAGGFELGEVLILMALLER